MLRIIKPLLGMLLFASASCSYSSSGIAATFSEIPLDAVTVQADESSTSEDLNFQISVADLPQLELDVRLTGFTVFLADRDGEPIASNFRAWTGSPAPGWQSSAVIETQSSPGGYRFEATDLRNGIVPGTTLDGFFARSSAASTSGDRLRVNSISTTNSTAIPEAILPLSSMLVFGGFFSLCMILKRKQNRQDNA